MTVDLFERPSVPPYSEPALREEPLLGSCCSSLFPIKLGINLRDSSRAAASIDAGIAARISNDRTHSPGRASRLSQTSASGHEDQFPRPSLSGRCRLGEATFAAMGRKEEDAPIAVIHVDRNRLIWPAGDLVYLD